MLRRTLDTTRTRYHSGMTLSVLDLTVLKRICVGYMVFTFIHLEIHLNTHMPGLFSSPAVLLLDSVGPVLLPRTRPSSSRMILSTRAELFVPSVLVGRCKVITLTESAAFIRRSPQNILLCTKKS